jgi:soluble lytic murein transglycosylase
MKRYLLLLAATGLAVLCAATAGATWRGRADSLYLRANSLYGSHDYAEAAGLYRRTIEAVEAGGEAGSDSYFGRLGARSRFLKASCHENLEEWDEAIAGYEASLEELDEVWDLIRLRLSACHAGGGDYAAAIEQLMSIVDDEESTLFRQRALHDLIDYHERSGDFEAALEWARSCLDEASSYDDRALAHLRTGMVHERRGDRDSAVESYATAVNDFPRSRHADDALKRGRNMSRAFTDRYHQGLVLYNRNHYRDATEFFLYYIRHDREREFYAEAHYFLGRSYQRRGSFGTAAGKYEDAIECGPDTEYFDLAWSKLAYCRRADGRLEESLTTYDDYLSLHGERDAAPDILWEKSRLLEEKGRWGEAAAAFRLNADLYPESEKAPDALFRAALCLYKMKHYELSESLLARIFVDAEGGEAARALFWAGKCREQLGAPDEAVARYLDASEEGRDSYYGVRSRERLGVLGHAVDRERASPRGGGRPHSGMSGVWSGELLDFAAWLAEWYDEVYFPAGRTAMKQELHARPAMVRADVLLALHMRDEALVELTALANEVGADPRALDILEDYCRRRGLHKRAILLAERMLSMSPAETLSDAPVYLRKRVCPVHFTDLVERNCRDTGVDPSVFYSLMRQESLFEPGAVSWVGARGLSQIMPRTGRWLARRLGQRGFHTSHLFDPELNLWFGTRYLAMQLEEFDGDMMRALAAYNGGADSVERWWGYGGGRDSDVFVEDIGYAQTADYVRKVYRYSETYREIHGVAGTPDSQW